MCVEGLSVTSLGGFDVIVTSLGKDALKYEVQLQFPTTNNAAEYEAILTSIRIVKALRVKNLKLRTNSKLIVGQITNKYEAKEEIMKRYLKLTDDAVNLTSEMHDPCAQESPTHEKKTRTPYRRHRYGAGQTPSEG